MEKSNNYSLSLGTSLDETKFSVTDLTSDEIATQPKQLPSLPSTWQRARNRTNDSARNGASCAADLILLNFSYAIGDWRQL